MSSYLFQGCFVGIQDLDGEIIALVQVVGHCKGDPVVALGGFELEKLLPRLNVARHISHLHLQVENDNVSSKGRGCGSMEDWVGASHAVTCLQQRQIPQDHGVLFVQTQGKLVAFDCLTVFAIRAIQ
jgi:hypothetical protein